MQHPVISCFSSEFERFSTLLEKQIQSCPEELWVQPAGGYPFWQHHLHVLCCVEIYAGSTGSLKDYPSYSREVIMLSETSQQYPTKEEILELATEMRAKGSSFINNQNIDSLARRHDGLSSLLGKDVLNQNAVIALIRHLCYHLGCCDTALREHGFPGVY